MTIDEHRPDLHVHMEPAELQARMRRHFTAYFSRCVSCQLLRSCLDCLNDV